MKEVQGFKSLSLQTTTKGKKFRVYKSEFTNYNNMKEVQGLKVWVYRLQQKERSSEYTSLSLQTTTKGKKFWV